MSIKRKIYGFLGEYPVGGVLLILLTLFLLAFIFGSSPPSQENMIDVDGDGELDSVELGDWCFPDGISVPVDSKITVMIIQIDRFSDNDSFDLDVDNDSLYEYKGVGYSQNVTIRNKGENNILIRRNSTDEYCKLQIKGYEPNTSLENNSSN